MLTTPATVKDISTDTNLSEIQGRSVEDIAESTMTVGEYPGGAWKRKRLDESPTVEKDTRWPHPEQKARRIVEVIKELEERVNGLSIIAEAHSNTRVDIKEGILRLQNLALQLAEEDHLEFLKNVGGRGHVDKCDGATQTGEDDLQVTEQQIRAVKNIKDFDTIKNMQWKESLYTTKIVNESVVRAGRDSDLLVWQEKPREGAQTERILNRHEELRETRGDAVHVYLTSKTVDGDGTERIQEQVLIKRTTDGSEADCFDTLKEVRQWMSEHGRGALALYPPCEESRGPLFRKMIECVFAGSGVACAVHYEAPLTGAVARREREVTSAIIVGKPEGGTYADLLKKVKSGLEADEDWKLKKTIKSMRQGREGGLVITTQAGGDAMTNLKEMLKRTGCDNVRSSEGRFRNAKTLYIKGMDAVTNKREVIEAVRERTGTEPLRIGDLRPYFGGCQAVTVVVAPWAAERLLHGGNLRIAYNDCAVMGKIDVIQCFRCWAYGHVSSACESAEDRGADCRKCGERGHKKVECPNEKRCPVCKKEGHSVGEGTCSEWRRAIREKRQELRAGEKARTSVSESVTMESEVDKESEISRKESEVDREMEVGGEDAATYKDGRAEEEIVGMIDVETEEPASKAPGTAATKEGTKKGDRTSGMQGTGATPKKGKSKKKKGTAHDQNMKDFGGSPDDMIKALYFIK